MHHLSLGIFTLGSRCFSQSFKCLRHCRKKIMNHCKKLSLSRLEWIQRHMSGFWARYLYTKAGHITLPQSSQKCEILSVSIASLRILILYCCNSCAKIALKIVMYCISVISNTVWYRFIYR